MPQKKSNHIPVNTLASGIRQGIYIAKTSFNGLPHHKEVERPHRDNGHLFILQEKGTTHIEIDFQKHHIEEGSILYIHPNQIHRVIGFDNVTITSWIITSENLNQENLKLLDTLAPLEGLALQKETFSIILQTASLFILLSERKQEKMYNSILKESLNTLVSLVISQYLNTTTHTDHSSRFQLINQSFKVLLESNFNTSKSPMEYAQSLNISTPYLNECVKTATGQSVSYHIQQRVVLEAKRLLYHSKKSVKEIAGELGYDDFSYFSRLFVKVTGMTPLTFRNKNLD